ncbi:MAG: response regulator [Elusimicrobia bacterium]|nr:response regulator [Elusimicrobiota bacterium]
MPDAMEEPQSLEEDRGKPADKLIVIVDDDDSVRELLEFVVTKEGFRVQTAVDGEEAVRRISEIMPDLVILDMMLPRYGGFEVLRELQHGPTASIPIVIITGRYSDRSTTDMIRQESNVREFLEKPVRPPALAMLLHKLLHTRPVLDSSKGGW